MADNKVTSTYTVSLPDLQGRPRLVWTNAWRFGEPAKGSDLEQVHHAYQCSRRAMLDTDQLRQRLKSEGKLTDLGIKEEVQKAVSAEKATIAKMRSNVLAPRRQKILERMAQASAVRPRDAGDAAGAVNDWGLAQWFGSLSSEQRLGAISRATAGDAPELAAALLRLPSYVTGITETTLETLRRGAIPAEQRDVVAGLEADLEPIELAIRALEVAERELDAMAGSVALHDDGADKGQPSEDDPEKPGTGGEAAE